MTPSENDYSPQTVFDATVRHLASMPGPAVTRSSATHDSWSCRYRGPGGSRCAVGFWIPDDKYSPRMEKKQILGGVGCEIVQAALPEPLRTPLLLRLLAGLQEIHDFEFNWMLDKKHWDRARMATELRTLARRRRLKAAVVKECFG